MVRWIAYLSGLVMLAAMPASTNYKLNNYSFGNGGVSDSSSTNYRLNAVSGEQSTTTQTSTNYNNRSGEKQTQQANVPIIALTNPTSSGNSLKFVIDPQSNPTDTTFAIAISSDGFATTNYIKNDNTVTASLSLADYQTYAAWGGAAGASVVGLSASTTYTVKAKAMAGKFTETGYGPTSSAATTGATMSFAITTDLQSVPPFSVDIGSLVPGSQATATNKIHPAITTNGANGATIFISGANSGLTSSIVSNTITSATASLNSASRGYGAFATGTQTSGGPLSTVSPFVETSGLGYNVGVLNTTVQPILSSSAAITAGVGTITLSAKSATTDAAANDYTDTLTLIASAAF